MVLQLREEDVVAAREEPVVDLLLVAHELIGGRGFGLAQAPVRLALAAGVDLLDGEEAADGQVDDRGAHVLGVGALVDEGADESRRRALRRLEADGDRPDLPAGHRALGTVGRRDPWGQPGELLVAAAPPHEQAHPEPDESRDEQAETVAAAADRGGDRLGHRLADPPAVERVTRADDGSRFGDHPRRVGASNRQALTRRKPGRVKRGRRSVGRGRAAAGVVGTAYTRGTADLLGRLRRRDRDRGLGDRELPGRADRVDVELLVVREVVERALDLVLDDVGLLPSVDVALRVADPQREELAVVRRLVRRRGARRARHVGHVERVEAVGVLALLLDPDRPGDEDAAAPLAGRERVVDCLFAQHRAVRLDLVVDSVVGDLFVGGTAAPGGVEQVVGVVGPDAGHRITEELADPRTDDRRRRGHRRGEEHDERQADGGHQFAQHHRSCREDIARSASRRSWRSRSAWRLSYSRLPLARASSTLARPSLK